MADKKPFPPEAQDVTEPLPGMPSPIEQAYIDRMQKKKSEQKEPPKTEKPKKMAKGGYVRAADGCAQRGKTRGKIV